jgi:hypothetical protein
MGVPTYGLERPVRIDVAICIWASYIVFIIFIIQVFISAYLWVRWTYFGGRFQAHIEKRLSFGERPRINTEVRAASTFEVENGNRSGLSELENPK